MKAIIVTILLLCSESLFAQQQLTGYLQAPVSGDCLALGQPTTLRWSADSSVSSTVHLSYWSQTEGQWLAIGDTVFGAGIYTWTVPAFCDSKLIIRAVSDRGDALQTGGFVHTAPSSLNLSLKRATPPPTAGKQSGSLSYADGKLRVEMPTASNVAVIVSDMLGRTQSYQLSGSPAELPLALPEGAYVVMARSTGVVLHTKVVVIR